MSEIIDVLILHDAASILQDHPAQSSQTNQSNPPNQSSSGSNGNWTPLKNGGRSYVFLVAPWSKSAQTGNSDQQEGGYELQITVKVGDVVRYRLQNLLLRRDFQGFIEQIDVTTGEQCLTQPSLQRRASTSTTLAAPPASPPADPPADPPAGPPNAPDQVTPIDITDTCWETTMTQTGMAALSVKFKIYDDKAALRGSFSFSPWLNVQA